MTVFDQQQEQTQENSSTNADETQQQQFLSELVGEGKKYANTEELAKGTAHANQFIDQLKEELQGLREDLSKRATAEELLQQARNELSEAQKSSNEENTTPQLDVDAIKSLVTETFQQSKQEEVQQTNILKADKMMKDIYGDKAGDVLNNKISTLGLGMDFVMGVAAKSPEAFMNLIGETAGNQSKSASSGVTQGTVNTQSMSQQTMGMANEGTWDYYQDMRRKDPKKYWDPKTQNEIMQKRANGQLSLPS